MKAAILAIGTELSLGQITNRNASWLGARLHELGVFAAFHRVVPDDRALIVSEMQDLAAKVELLVVSGGLGPTTDDFTRECVAEFLGRPLVWDEDSWVWIQAKLSERGVAVREFQKQQCFYPVGAVILKNERGTAHGFRVEIPGGSANPLRHVIVLPGPPAEVESAFENGVRPWMEPWKSKLDPLELRIWECIGVGESDVADRAEKALVGCPFDKAYRVHLPYVEFKLLYPFSRRTEAQVWCDKVDAALSPWVALRDGEDAVENLMKSVQDLNVSGRILLVDEVTEGLFAERLAQAMKGSRLNLLTAKVPLTEGDLELHLSSPDTLNAIASVTWMGQVRNCQITAPQRTSTMTERRRQYFLESALLEWAREISKFARETRAPR